jgi:galactofuranosylgalactofuranosylrhamnosyl-N-acetylglucosaminyl-diphospho-decaprenol beta-1,5/1,6-galactofuranosyltransferase
MRENGLLQKNSHPSIHHPGELFYMLNDTASGKRKISTDTYFNRFSVTFWSAASQSNSFQIEVKSEPYSAISVLGTLEGDTVTLNQSICDGSGVFSFVFKGDSFSKIWLELEISEETQLSSLDCSYYLLDKTWKPKSCSIVICTFKNFSMIENSLKKLLNEYSPGENNLQVIIVDQGNQIIDFEGFENVTLIKQKNMGGSGGFTRGMYESVSRNLQGVILMDDDIDFIPEVILRVMRAASVSDQLLAIPSQMLDKQEPTMLLNEGEYIDLKKLWTMPIAESERNFHANATMQSNQPIGMIPWWCSYISCDLIKSVKYPLPLFLHWDDMEYSLRIQKIKEARIMKMGGFGVWHEPFAKKRTLGIIYLDTRNRLIGSCIHDAKNLHIVLTISKILIKSILKKRFTNNKAILLGVNDFLQGPQVLETDNLEKIYGLVTSPVSENSNLVRFNSIELLVRILCSAVGILKLVFLLQCVKRRWRDSMDILSSESFWVGRWGSRAES